jgi:hypothetical protein
VEISNDDFRFVNEPMEMVQKSGGEPDKAGFELIRIHRSVGIGSQWKVSEGIENFESEIGRWMSVMDGKCRWITVNFFKRSLDTKWETEFRSQESGVNGGAMKMGNIEHATANFERRSSVRRIQDRRKGFDGGCFSFKMPFLKFRL